MELLSQTISKVIFTNIYLAGECRGSLTVREDIVLEKANLK